VYLPRWKPTNELAALKITKRGKNAIINPAMAFRMLHRTYVRKDRRGSAYGRVRKKRNSAREINGMKDNAPRNVA